jgi:hypothetical protein
MRLIELAFTSKNVIAEICDRHKNGVVGVEPRWRWVPKRFLKKGETPTDTEASDIAEIESLVTAWWDSREVNTIFQKAVRNSLALERGPIRLYIPDGSLIVENGIPGVRIGAGDLEGALNLIWPEAPDPEFAGIWCDPRTKREMGIVVTKDMYQQDVIHFTFLQPTGRLPESTVYKILPLIGRGFRYSINLGGRLLMNEIRRRRLVSDQIIQSQKALNLAVSMIPRTVVTSGFLERMLLNAQMPGEFQDIKDAGGNVIGKRFVPNPPTFGAGTTNYVAPLAVEDEDATGRMRTVLAKADVKWRDPVDPQFAMNAAIFHYQNMLEEADQEHVLINSAATPSGKSREEARSEYGASLGETSPHVNRVGRWFLETLVAYAEEIAGTPGRFTSRYRAVFECNTDTGPLTADEKRQITEAGDKGYLSACTVMERIGVEDVDAENNRILAEKQGSLGQMVQRATVMKLLADSNFPIPIAAKLLGFPEEIIPEIERMMKEQQQQQIDQARATAAARQPFGGGAGARKNGGGKQPSSAAGQGRVPSY